MAHLGLDRGVVCRHGHRQWCPVRQLLERGQRGVGATRAPHVQRSQGRVPDRERRGTRVAQDQLTPRCGCCAHIDVSQRDRGEAGVGLEQQGALAENAVGRDAVQGDRAGRRGRGLPDEGNAVLGTAAAARDCHIRERGDAVERIERHVVGMR